MYRLTLRIASSVLVLFGSCIALSASARLWVEVASLPKPRWFLKAAVGNDGRVYAFGGWLDRKGGQSKGKGIGEDALLSFDRAANVWTPGPPITYFRHPTLVCRTTSFRGNQVGRDCQGKDIGKKELSLEGPLAAADGRGWVFWFSRVGPVFFDPTRQVWGQPPGPVWDQERNLFRDGAAPHLDRVNAATATGPDGKLYLLGGAGHALGERDHEKRLLLLNSLEVYDPVANTYAMKAPMQQGRQIFAAEFGQDGKLYAFGGYGTVPSVGSRKGESPEEFERRRAEMDQHSRRALDSVEAYDPATDTWTKRRKLPRPVMSGEAARCPDGRIYLVGGERSLDDARAVDDVWIYDASRDEWTEGPPLRTPRHGHGLACTSDGKLYAIGGTNHYTVPNLGSLLGGEGRDEGGPLASVEMLDTTKLRRGD